MSSELDDRVPRSRPTAAVPVDQRGVRPWFTSGSPYEELGLPYDPTAPQQRVAKRRKRFVSRVISLVLTLAIMVGLYLWQREQFASSAPWVLYGIVVGVSLVFLLVAFLAWRQAKKILAGLGQGLALRLGRPGVEIAGAYVSWDDLQGLAVTKGKLGHGPQLTVTRTDGYSLSVPLDQLDVYPATLDSTARAYSGGRFGVDLTALEN
ncbi:hypothetical protein GCM10022204_21810 [Microlunatus aurantiacus]|uniref:PH domain-containing protein n=1 Tax=Microlunatus aurantiacus TaxID=446786 RepID=A0ABP7DGJ1_9ACTN